MEEATKHDEGKPEYGRIGFFGISALWGKPDCKLSVALDFLHTWEVNRSYMDLETALRYLVNIVGFDEFFKVLEFGASEYGWDNWREGGMKYSRLVNACARHVLACIADRDLEAKDKESGLCHIAHAACCVLFLLGYEAYSIGQDDWWRI